MEERASALNVRDSSPTLHVTGQTVTCSKQPGTRAKPSWDHQWCLEETASSTALSLQFWAWKEGLAMSAVIPHSIISSSQLLSAAILCWQSFRDKWGKVIDYSLQCPSYCPKCTGSCSVQLCLQPLAGLPLHRTLITKLGQMKGTLKVPTSVPKLLSENKACPNTFPWHVPEGISMGNTSDSYQTSQLLDSQLWPVGSSMEKTLVWRGGIFYLFFQWAIHIVVMYWYSIFMVARVSKACNIDLLAHMEG